MAEKPYKSPLAIHEEAAHLFPLSRPKGNGPSPNGREIACLVGGINEEPIEALYDASTRTAYPVRDTN